MLQYKGKEDYAIYAYSLLLIASLIYTFSFWSKPDIINSDLQINARYASQYFQAWHAGQWLPQGISLPYYHAPTYAFPVSLISIGISPYPAMVLNAIFVNFFRAMIFYYFCRKSDVPLFLSLATSVLFLFYPVMILSGAIILWVIRSSEVIRGLAMKELQKSMALLKSPPLWLEAAIIAAAPCFLLFDIHSDFYNDWFNQLWVIGYTGSYFLTHFNFPDVLNTSQVVGVSLPIFYGSGLYHLLGLLCNAFNPHVAVLIGAYALYSLQHGSLVFLLTRMTLPRWFASMAGIIVTFAVYPLTNLYNRGALTEFFATLAMTIAITALLLSLTLERREQKKLWFIISLLMFGFMAMAHPITLLNAGIFMSFFCPLLWLSLQLPLRKIFLPLLSIPLTLCVLLSPWLYATLTLGDELSITKKVFFYLYPNDIDWIVTRLSPVLFDRRLWHTPFNQIPTPYLDAQANLFLLGIALLPAILIIRQCGLYRRFLLLVSVMFAAFWFYMWCSVSIYPYDHLLPLSYRIIQFPYRLVSFINLAALCLLFGIGLWVKSRKITLLFPQGTKTLAIVLCTAASCAFVQKMIHASAVKTPSQNTVFLTLDDQKKFLQPPSTMYGLFEYVTAGLYENQTVPPAGDVSFPVSPDSFGDVPPLNISAPTTGWYKTNVYAFRWNDVLIDQKIPPYYLTNGQVLSVHLTAGNHELQYIFNPPAVFRILTYVSQATAGAFIIYLFFLGCCRIFGSRSSSIGN